MARPGPACVVVLERLDEHQVAQSKTATKAGGWKCFCKCCRVQSGIEGPAAGGGVTVPSRKSPVPDVVMALAWHDWAPEPAGNEWPLGRTEREKATLATTGCSALGLNASAASSWFWETHWKGGGGETRTNVLADWRARVFIEAESRIVQGWRKPGSSW